LIRLLQRCLLILLLAAAAAAAAAPDGGQAYSNVTQRLICHQPHLALSELTLMRGPEWTGMWAM